MYTATDDNGVVHGKFYDFTNAGYYLGHDGVNKAPTKKKIV